MDLIKEVEREAKKYFVNARPTHDWGHVERVKALSEKIGKGENANMLIVRLAVLLHDIGREAEVKSKGQICHAEESAKIAREILGKCNVDNSIMEQVCHCVIAHRFRNKCIPETKEAKVLYDADKLDAIGATGVARAYLFAGEIGAKLHNEEKNIRKTESYTKEDTGQREFVVKLRKIKDRMLTKTGKRIADGRHKFMVEFFNKFEKERLGEE